MLSFDDREKFLIEKGISEDQIHKDYDTAREWYYETDENGRKEKVYLEDVVLGFPPGGGQKSPPGDE